MVKTRASFCASWGSCHISCTMAPAVTTMAWLLSQMPHVGCERTGPNWLDPGLSFGPADGRGWKHTISSLAVLRVLGWALLAWVATNLPTQVRGLCSARSSRGFTDGLLASTCPGARVRGLMSGRLGDSQMPRT